MTSNLRWAPFLSLFVREVRRFMKIIYQTLATPIINTLLYLLIFGLSIGNQIDAIRGFPYLAFLIPGLVMMGALRNALENSTGSIMTAKFCGELEDLRIVPLSPTQIAWANGLAATLRGILVGALTLAMGMIFYYVAFGTHLPLAHPFLLLLFLIIGGLAFAQLGLAITMISTHIEQVSAINTFILLPLIYLGGVFFSLDHLHPFWQTLSSLNPLLYLVNGVRYSILESSDVPLQTCLLVTIATFGLFHLLALWSLKYGSFRRW